MKNILATTSSFNSCCPEISRLLSHYDLNLTVNPYGRKLGEGELSAILSDRRPIGLLAGTETITEGILESAKDYLQVISRVGTGWDNIDRSAAERHGILVYRTEGVLTQAVAELTIGMIISALRHLPLHDRLTRHKIWRKNMGKLFQGKILGIIGFGAVGRRVGELAVAFGAEVIFYDPQPASVTWARNVTLHELLKIADIISIHASGKEMILSRRELNYIGKQGVIIVNTSRGGAIDEIVLLDELRSGKVGYVCLDVFSEEPYGGPLCEIENALLAPHVGSYAEEAREMMELRAVENLIDGLKRKRQLA